MRSPPYLVGKMPIVKFRGIEKCSRGGRPSGAMMEHGVDQPRGRECRPCILAWNERHTEREREGGEKRKGDAGTTRTTTVASLESDESASWKLRRRRRRRAILFRPFFPPFARCALNNTARERTGESGNDRSFARRSFISAASVLRGTVKAASIKSGSLKYKLAVLRVA